MQVLRPVQIVLRPRRRVDTKQGSIHVYVQNIMRHFLKSQVSLVQLNSLSIDFLGISLYQSVTISAYSDPGREAGGRDSKQEVMEPAPSELMKMVQVS